MTQRKAAPPTGRVEPGERSNADPQPTTTSAQSSREWSAKHNPLTPPLTPPSPPAVVDYTEPAREIVLQVRKRYFAPGNEHVLELNEATDLVSSALSAIASEHQAEIARLRKELAEVGGEAGRLAAQYQALSGIIDSLRVADDANAKAALLARLGEPDEELIVACKKAIADYYPPAAAHHYLDGVVRAALAVITEKLTCSE